MKNKYYTYADMWLCPKGAVISEHSSYNSARDAAIKLVDSPAVEEAGVYVNYAHSLINRKLFSCQRDPYGFDPEAVDGDFNYTAENGDVVKPPKEYYILKGVSEYYDIMNANHYKGIKLLRDI